MAGYFSVALGVMLIMKENGDNNDVVILCRLFKKPYFHHPCMFTQERSAKQQILLMLTVKGEMSGTMRMVRHWPCQAFIRTRTRIQEMIT